MKTFPDFTAPPPSEKISITNTTGLHLPFVPSSLFRLLELVEIHENITFQSVEVVYVDEKNIVEINKEYLDHDYVTDIITFRYDDSDADAIEATLFCCAQRIDEQSREFKVSPVSEFLRVFVHGLIHLAGYDDQSEEEKEVMRNLENKYLELLNPSP
jgi:rRNA maturation RNase YbeY